MSDSDRSLMLDAFAALDAVAACTQRAAWELEDAMRRREELGPYFDDAGAVERAQRRHDLLMRVRGVCKAALVDVERELGWVPNE